MEIWKTEMTQRSMSQQMLTLTQEIERLQKVKGISESMMRLPMASLEDINTEKDILKVKESALHSALDQLRGKEYDAMVKDIDEIQNKSKRAYVRLYENVGEDIGNNFLDKLDHMSRQQSEADNLLAANQKGTSMATSELSRLQQEKINLTKMNK